VVALGCVCSARRGLHGFGAFKMHEHDQKAYNELAREFGEFKGKVAALGEKAKADALAQQAADKKRKEDADAQNARTHADDQRTIASLRNERDRARGRLLPSTGPIASGADVTCFDRPIVERAYGELVTALRGLADEGAAAVIDLNTAKRWAQK
jgi:hypothetical protein